MRRRVTRRQFLFINLITWRSGKIMVKLLFTFLFVCLRSEIGVSRRMRKSLNEVNSKAQSDVYIATWSKHERRALKGKATISRCFTTVIKRDFASETATNACLHSIPKLHLPAHPMTPCHFDLELSTYESEIVQSMSALAFIYYRISNSLWNAFPE